MNKARKKWKPAEIKHLKTLVKAHGNKHAIVLHAAKYGRTKWAVTQKIYDLGIKDKNITIEFLPDPSGLKSGFDPGGPIPDCIKPVYGTSPAALANESLIKLNAVQLDRLAQGVPNKVTRVKEPPIQWSMFIIGLAIGLGLGMAAFGVGF